MDVDIGTIRTILENEFGFDPPVPDKDAIEQWKTTFKEIAEHTPIWEAYFAPYNNIIGQGANSITHTNTNKTLP